MVEEKFRVPAGADLGEGPLPGWQDAAAFPLCPRWWGLRTLESSSLVDPTWTPPPNDITLRVWDLVWLLLPGESVFTAMYCRQPQAKGTAPLTCWTHEFSEVTYRSVDEGLTMLLCFFDTWPHVAQAVLKQGIFQSARATRPSQKVFSWIPSSCPPRQTQNPKELGILPACQPGSYSLTFSKDEDLDRCLLVPFTISYKHVFYPMSVTTGDA